MGDYRDFMSGDHRPPTWGEREYQQRLRDEGVADVFLEPEETPHAFWDLVLQATLRFLAGSGAGQAWAQWSEEIRWSNGWTTFGSGTDFQNYERIVSEGLIALTGKVQLAKLGDRISAVEHILEVVGDRDCQEFVERVNDRARWLRVGLRIEGRRFIPITEEHLHTEIVQPALLVLHDANLVEIDRLYRKAFDRVLTGDPAGAVTAASTAIEDMLRLGLAVKPGKGTLGELADQARSAGWLSAGAGQAIKSFAGLRKDSDAHTSGTSDYDLAMFAIHLAGSVIIHLSKTQPFAPSDPSD